jgi:hypothetical protein
LEVHILPSCLCYLKLFQEIHFSLNIWLQDLDISQESVLYEIDEATVRSLTGCRVADQILRLVPNIEVDSRNYNLCSCLIVDHFLFRLSRMAVLTICMVSCRTSEQH